jgi:hypothetical protein
VTAAGEWLRERLPDAPPRLLAAMIDALPSPSGAAVADDLAVASLTLLERVAARDGCRDDALPLLAADALLTHALEAQAEADVDGLADFVARWGAAGRLGAMAQALEPGTTTG